uniref:Uncharacterized protein n=1 Tax=Ananas comosus var. bracteatus TaxID=296719 RepID=A0A6V7QBQ4_ANACO|nr:unnamed protein product [Ananas comosus var. bracteatus]
MVSLRLPFSFPQPPRPPAVPMPPPTPSLHPRPPPPPPVSLLASPFSSDLRSHRSRATARRFACVGVDFPRGRPVADVGGAEERRGFSHRAGGWPAPARSRAAKDQHLGPQDH